ncbi:MULTISPECIES: cupin domain-containing protein [Pseudomonas]|uniref:cupin domain-containing protein n=1 Tax=Pseudomonas TaxID=286 RepID=UPI000D943451|nr:MULTISPECIES: cupin domain-containing protein [Pseudomonas]MBH3384623.1 cupin domain-containing protein [Pseudomonas juntendi]MBR7521484.1 cupin domain-containing protein [Pseudomonas juntendi]PYB96711.1 cupin domain-containing protein [Pseudomonas sp. MB-090624]WBM31628.1 cupin domain-containing protein [Pseudomonas sp. NY11382]
MQTLPAFRRIVTGHDGNGRAVVAMAGETPNNFPLKAVPGTVFYEVWSSHDSPASLDNSGDPTNKPLQLGPAASGSVIRVVDIPPDSLQNQVSAEEAAAAFAEIGQAQAGTGKPDSKHKLMHRTETLDYGIVTEGEVWLVLDGEDVHLKRGDIVVQRGTNHAWSNRTEQMARMVFILLDGRYADELRELVE